MHLNDRVEENTPFTQSPRFVFIFNCSNDIKITAKDGRASTIGTDRRELRKKYVFIFNLGRATNVNEIP
jgi:hypothetical protein